MEDDSDERDDTKRRSRNLSEKKRRDQFNSLVNDLNTLISAPGRKMDKSTVLKSTIAFLRHHNEATNRSKVFEIQQDWKPSFLSNDEFTQLMLESMDGFIIVFGSRGPIFYTSDSITALLGYLPCDLNKKTIFDLAYELDHENLLNVFVNHKPVIEPMQTDISSRNQITFFVHLKRGGIDERSSGNLYELVKFVGYFRNDANIESVGGEDVIQNTQTVLPRVLQMPVAKELDKKLIFVGTGRLQMPQMLREITVTDPTRSEFTSKHSMEWKFLFLDHRATPIVGYMPFEVLGTSGYDYYHFDDIDDIVACHEQLLHTGKGKTGFYRFLTKGQQWIWLQTDFCVSYNQYNSKPDYVVCTHRVVNYEDVLKTQKKDYQGLLSFDEIKSPATVYKDLDSANSNVDAVTPVSTTTSSLSTTNISGNLLVDIMSNENSPTMEALWRNTLTPTDAGTSHATPVKSASRPASNYSNISSTGVSPSVKRKRYPYYRGNDSDSTSMSADSSTSRQSLMTHVSSGRQKHSSNLYQTNLNSSGSQQQHHTHQNSMATTTHNQHSQTPHIHQQQQFHQQQTFQGNNNSAVNMLPQHMEANLTSNTSCQFSQPIFPLRGSQIMAPTFIEPPQYLTAIPVQPVIAPFPLAPVISPLPNQSDMLSGPMIMTSTQSQLQEQLQRKHNELQKLIKQQQEELRIVSEQLLMARYSMLHPMMPVNYALPTTMDGNNRNYNYNSNCVQPQFNQYGFAMNTAEIQNHHDQQIILQHQQSLQQQMHQNHAQQQQTTQQLQHIEMQSHLIHQQAQQQQQQQQPHQSQGLHHQQQHPQQQQQQQLLNIIRPSIDLDQLAQDELDAFLNLSPVHSVESSQSNLSNRNSVNNNYSVAPQNLNNTSNTNQPTTSNLNTLHTTPFTVNPVNSSEDSLLTYMQMTAESNSALNFPMAISDEGAESQNEDTKHLAHPTYRIGSGTSSVAPNQTANVAPPRKSSPAYFTANTFSKNSIAGQQNPNTNITSNISSETTTNPINSAANAADPTLTTDLNTILPYSITTEQPSENHIFNTTTHSTANSQ